MTFISYITGSKHRVTMIAALALALCLAPAGIANAQSPLPNLNLVAVGISNYANAPLTSPHKDAANMASLFAAQQGKLFGQVQATSLLNEQATTANVQQGLSWVASRATSETYTIVFLAGHGTNRNFQGEFEFMTYDGKVSWNQLKTSLQNLPGKVILILDSCHSGALTSSGNMIVFSSSLGFQESGETVQNGYFTQALLEGLSGKADMDHNGTITLAELDAYVAGRLDQISNGKQASTMLRPVNTPSSLPLAKLNMAAAGSTVTQVVNPVPPVFNNSNTGSVVPAAFTQPAFQGSGPVGN